MGVDTLAGTNVGHGVVRSIEGLLEEVFVSFLQLRPLVAAACLRETAQIGSLYHRAVVLAFEDVVWFFESMILKAEKFDVECNVVRDDLLR